MMVRKASEDRGDTPKAKTNAVSGGGRGHRSRYKPEYAEEARKLCAVAHATDLMLAKWFGVSERTINRWKVGHPDFAEGLRAGKKETDDVVERGVIAHITGYYVITEELDRGGKVRRLRRWVPGNAMAGLKWLAVRKPEEYREKKVEERDGDDGFLAALERMNERALLERAERERNRPQTN